MDLRLSEMLDAYTVQARLLPSLFVLLPVFVAVALLFPELFKLGRALVSLFVACGLAVFLADVARTYGRRAQSKLFLKWGGRPTTIWLRHRDNHLDALTKRRYHAFLESHVPGWKAPKEDDEERDPPGADAQYDSAVRWLIEHVRNRSLVFRENISFGFRRNAFGMKPLGLFTAVLAVILSLMVYYERWRSAGGLLPSAAVTASLSFSALSSMAWLVVIREEWVKEAGDAYARALLSCCDLGRDS